MKRTGPSSVMVRINEMESHVIAYRMHVAVHLLLSIDWDNWKWHPEGPLVGRLKGQT